VVLLGHRLYEMREQGKNVKEEGGEKRKKV
jgi:hypothetical protein